MKALSRAPLAAAVLACAVAACHPSGPPGMTPEQQAAMAIDAQLAGTWKLSSYTPEQAFSLALLLGMQKDAIVVSFQNGRVRSANTVLSFDRRYRIQSVGGETFKVFISDEQGVEYESWARFGRPDQIWFESKTDPWKGQGTLERVAPGGFN